MSFVDLEAKPRKEESNSSRVLSSSYGHDKDVVELLRSLSTCLQSFGKKVNLLGSSRDEHGLRDVIETKDIPQCEELRDSLHSNVNSKTRDKYISDFEVLNAEFLRLKREYQTRKISLPLRTKVQKEIGSGWHDNGPSSGLPSNRYVSIQTSSDEQTPLLSQQQQQLSVTQDHMLQDELDFHSLIQDVRNQEISKIHSEVQDVNAIFKQLGTLVNEQGKQVDTIDQNINGLRVNLEGASQKLRKADEYQSRKNRCGTFTLSVIAVVTLVVVLIILS